MSPSISSSPRRWRVGLQTAKMFRDVGILVRLSLQGFFLAGLAVSQRLSQLFFDFCANFVPPGQYLGRGAS